MSYHPPRAGPSAGRAGKDRVGETVYFLSDAHFKIDASIPAERRKRDYFIDFLARIEGTPRLYLLGDIFDFWFESPSFVPPFYDDLLAALSRLRAGGTRIFICGGNHDYWLGAHIRDTLGFEILEPFATHEIQGRRVTMTHGDALLPGDYAYKTLKAVIRSAPVIALARRLPPSLLYGFAKRFSTASKSVTSRLTERAARVLIARAPTRFFRWGNDVFVTGHVHWPHVAQFDGRVFAIVGDWDRSFSYLACEDGRFDVRFYRPAEAIESDTR